MSDDNNDDLAGAVNEAFDTGPRYSPAARRFMSGDMPNCEAAKLGFATRDPDHECEHCELWR